MNALDKLIEIQKRNEKNKETAINLLLDIENILIPFFEDFYDTKNDFVDEPKSICIHTWNKQKGKYTCNETLYFTFSPFYKRGFQVVLSNTLEHVSVLEGDDFWIKIKEITEWLEKGLLLYLEKNMKSRDQRVERLQKFIEKLK